MEHTNKHTGMKLDPAHWDALINEWKISGESQRAFCVRKGLSYNTFVYSRMKHIKNAKTSPKSSFARAKISAPPRVNSADSIRVLCAGGTQIIIPVMMPQAELAGLLKLIGVVSC